MDETTTTMWVIIEGFYLTPLKTTMWLSTYRPICRLTYDRGGFDGVHHLLQGLHMWVIVSKLLFLVVKMASSLNLGKRMVLFGDLHTGDIWEGWVSWQMHTVPLQWDLLNQPTRSSWQLLLYLIPVWPWPSWADERYQEQPGKKRKKRIIF